MDGLKFFGQVVEVHLDTFAKPVQKKFRQPVILLLYFSQFAVVQMQIDSNTTGWMNFFYTGKDFVESFCIHSTIVL